MRFCFRTFSKVGESHFQAGVSTLKTWLCSQTCLGAQLILESTNGEDICKIFEKIS